MPKSWVFEELKEELVGLPNDDVQETKDPDTLDDELHESTLELNEASNKLDDVLEATSSLSEAYEELQEVEALVESTLPSETTDEPSGESEDSDSADTSGDKQGLDEVTAEALRITLKSVCSKINLDHKKIFYNVSQEDFKGLTPRSRVVKTKIALEGIREFASKVYQAILKFLAKVKEYLVRFLTSAKEYLSKLTSKMRAKIREFIEKVKGLKEFNNNKLIIADGQLLFDYRKLSIDDIKERLHGYNKVVNVFTSKDYINEVQNLIKEIRNIIENTIKKELMENDKNFFDKSENYYHESLNQITKLYAAYRDYEKNPYQRKKLAEAFENFIESFSLYASQLKPFIEDVENNTFVENVRAAVENLVRKTNYKPTMITVSIRDLIKSFLPNSDFYKELVDKEIYDIIKIDVKPVEMIHMIKDVHINLIPFETGLNYISFSVKMLEKKLERMKQHYVITSYTVKKGEYGDKFSFDRVYNLVKDLLPQDLKTGSKINELKYIAEDFRKSFRYKLNNYIKISQLLVRIHDNLSRKVLSHFFRIS